MDKEQAVSLIAAIAAHTADAGERLQASELALRQCLRIEAGPRLAGGVRCRVRPVR